MESGLNIIIFLIIIARIQLVSIDYIEFVDRIYLMVVIVNRNNVEKFICQKDPVFKISDCVISI